MTKSFRIIVLALVAGLMLLPASAFAQATATGSQDVTATISAEASLTLGDDVVTFSSQNPSSVSSIAQDQTGAELDVTADARTSDTGNVTLTVEATQDLTSTTNSSDTIAINNITWTATGNGYTGGTMSASSAQSVGSWTGSGVNNGTMTYYLNNQWTYATGSYTTQFNYTLTAP